MLGIVCSDVNQVGSVPARPGNLRGLFKHLADGGKRQAKVLSDLCRRHPRKKGSPHRLALPLL